MYPRTLSTRESRNAFLEMVAEFQKVTGGGTAASGTYRDVINRRILKMDYATDGTLHFYISKQEKGTGREQADGRKPETDAEYISRRRKNQRSIPN